MIKEKRSKQIGLLRTLVLNWDGYYLFTWNFVSPSLK